MFSTFRRPGATFALPYRLAGRKFIYEDDLLELYAKFLKCHEIRQQARFTYRAIIFPKKTQS
jgi:hypothetical protein